MAGAADPSLLQTRPHRRLNALTSEWVFVSPQRTLRPWDGHQETVATRAPSAYDPQCPLCPGNTRANGLRNPDYRSSYVFDNDFPAFLDHDGSCEGEDREPSASMLDLSAAAPLLTATAQRGVTRVICYTPRHDLTLAQLPEERLLEVIDAWASQEAELMSQWRWVQIFENKGEIMGCSNAHPHGQIWAGDFIPNEVTKELASQQHWLEAHATPLLIDYLQLEVLQRERVVLSNSDWVALVPWWALWPFETLLLPRRHVRRLCDLSKNERRKLAALLSRLLRSYDALFGVSFPYSFGWHGMAGAGCEGEEFGGCQLHAHFYPPLLRSASVRKFMVGYEMLAEAQRDLTAEQAAECLRSAARTLGEG